MSTKKKSTTEAEVPERPGMILWTDGGARPSNPGPAGWGLHGYMFNAVAPKKGSGNADYVLTNAGYIAKAEYQKANPPAVTEQLWEETVGGSTKVYEVTPIHYVDGYGSFAQHETNNHAELVGAIRALEYAYEYDIKVLRLHLDSQYVREGITKWINGWLRNNWTTQQGEPVKNSNQWRELLEAKSRLELRGVRVEWHWVRGHGTDLGNNIADRYARVGCFESRERQIAKETSNKLHSIESTAADGYWKYEVDKHPFITHRRVYFNTSDEYVEPGVYYIGDHGKDDELLGKRISDGAYAVIQLGTPCPALELLRRRQIQLADGANTIIMGRLDQLYNAETHEDVTTYGILSMERHKQYLLDLRTLTEKPLTHELKPARLAHRVAEAVDELISWRELYLAGSPKISVTDLGSILYETTIKAAKKPKDGQPREETTEFTLKSEYNTGFAKLPVEAKYVSADGIEGFKTAPLILVLGMDLPDRNALKRLESHNPKVSLITWMETPEIFRYATVIETQNDIGIWAGYYSNTRVVGS